MPSKIFSPLLAFGLCACLAACQAEPEDDEPDASIPLPSLTDASCVPAAGCPNGVECGEISDGCGGTLTCGSCGEGSVCQSGTCEVCEPITCDDLEGAECGEIDDGCGGTLTCGCPTNQKCQEGRCLPCPDYSCEDFGAQCGTVDEGCGRDPLYCGTCEGDGVSCVDNKCLFCVPGTAAERCALFGAQCGTVSDGCGGTVECGLCGAPDSCAANTCICEPITCEEQGITCGEAYDGCGRFISCGPACTGGETAVIRLVTGNITSGGYQSYDEGHGLRIFRGLRPQVAFVQEFRYGKSTAGDLRTMVTEGFGERFFHVVEPQTENNMIPNGVVSYFPIKAWGTLEDDNVGGTRDHTWARIDIPGEHDLWAVSVHLSTTANKRQLSAKDLVIDLQSLGIPPGDFVAIAGDYNTKKRTDSALKNLASTGLVVIDTDEDCPIDQDGDDGTSSDRSHPYDAIYTSQNLKDLQTQVVIGSAKNLSKRGLVFDSRVFKPLSEVAPVQKNDSGAAQMQHMAVVKDYAIPR